ncbi:hypothetical protein C4588_02780 [Candidatus Parcubacteria bacterium]|nr:MAG: hypothetical protein C4588_02780 [Candidatus Parcubacteria bacterium]
MKLKETFDWYAKEGYLVAIPNGNLTLYDYTNQCALKGNWNYHTKAARGLVLDHEGNYISRPLPKFFNLDEREEVYFQNLPKELPEVAEKLDGSLVIVFQHPTSKKWMATTRRSWNNIQTVAAYKWLERNSNKLEPGFTYCFELVAPWNKVVVSYDQEEMILIAMIDTYGIDRTYMELTEFAQEHDLQVTPFNVRRIDTIDPDDIPENMEGYVARFSNGVRVKIKGTWYLEKHKDVV